MKRAWFIIVGLLTAPIVARSPVSPVQQWFETANAAYRDQVYDTAIVYYQKIVATGLENSAVYFNLGNAYFRTNRLGKAVLYYEKARALAPGDPDIEANLLFVNKHLADRPPMPERSFIESVFWRLHILFTLNAQLWLLWAVLVALAILFSAGLFVSRNVRLWFIYLGCLGAGAGIFLGVSVGIKIYQAENVRAAIVMERSADALNQPNGSKVLFTIHEGTRVTIRAYQGDWCLVSLPNGVSGWIEGTMLGEI